MVLCHIAYQQIYTYDHKYDHKNNTDNNSGNKDFFRNLSQIHRYTSVRFIFIANAKSTCR